MKKLLFLLLLPLMFACSSDDDKEPDQEYTSFVVVNNTVIDMPTVVVGYKEGDSWVRVAALGDLNKGQSSEEIILSRFISEDLYIFTDYSSPRRLNVVFNLKENKKNTFKFPKEASGTLTDKEDPTQYPQ